MGNVLRVGGHILCLLHKALATLTSAAASPLRATGPVATSDIPLPNPGPTLLDHRPSTPPMCAAAATAATSRATDHAEQQCEAPWPAGATSSGSLIDPPGARSARPPATMMV